MQYVSKKRIHLLLDRLLFDSISCNKKTVVICFCVKQNISVTACMISWEVLTFHGWVLGYFSAPRSKDPESNISKKSIDLYL